MSNPVKYRKELLPGGALDRRLIVQDYGFTQSDSGFEERTWFDFVSRWCNVGNQIGTEDTQSLEKVAENTTTFVTRWFDGLREDMRILYKDEVYDILSIKEITRRRGLMIRAKRKDANDIG